MKTRIISSAQVNMEQDPLAETLTILARIIVKYISATNALNPGRSITSKAGGPNYGPDKSSS